MEAHSFAKFPYTLAPAAGVAGTGLDACVTAAGAGGVCGACIGIGAGPDRLSSSRFIEAHSLAKFPYTLAPAAGVAGTGFDACDTAAGAGGARGAGIGIGTGLDACVTAAGAGRACGAGIGIGAGPDRLSSSRFIEAHSLAKFPYTLAPAAGVAGTGLDACVTAAGAGGVCGACIGIGAGPDRLSSSRFIEAHSFAKFPYTLAPAAGVAGTGLDACVTAAGAGGARGAGIGIGAGPDPLSSSRFIEAHSFAKFPYTLAPADDETGTGLDACVTAAGAGRACGAGIGIGAGPDRLSSSRFIDAHSFAKFPYTLAPAAGVAGTGLDACVTAAGAGGVRGAGIGIGAGPDRLSSSRFIDAHSFAKFPYTLAPAAGVAGTGLDACDTAAGAGGVRGAGIGIGAGPDRLSSSRFIDAHSFAKFPYTLAPAAGVAGTGLDACDTAAGAGGVRGAGIGIGAGPDRLSSSRFIDAHSLAKFLYSL
ncbi:predicted protein [Phaeodactylum tricornutum CCAP 1055/1]|uniref:Uncharacterized protein n=2 Tax=Phaeodactylum tricornutum TaxID=2850 RepID=B7GCF1_PHATC|nr:predicted protein [Phaeodactylum tricornutum CCAP 1055/1]EEC43759.1 predicted protein [Phaeodactylum tricornutum CCAP 1055/1]|eukprot:XP_002184700.1 predicted protein [Phaeodactylum tricornutum CCAP 1055/1]